MKAVCIRTIGSFVSEYNELHLHPQPTEFLSSLLNVDAVLSSLLESKDFDRQTHEKMYRNREILVFEQAEKNRA